jgi:pimeloyl-ACP methyl ester carboxylesterase
MHVAEGGNAKDIENETALNAQIFYAIKNYDVEIAKKMVEKYMDEFELTLNDEKLEEFKRSRDSIKQSVFTPWFVYFIKFEAEKYLSKIKCPVLALNGEKDTQVIADSNLKAIALILKNSGNKNVKTIKFENLNHLFQTAKTGGFSEYGEIEETFSPAVLKVMGEWILSLK